MNFQFLSFIIILLMCFSCNEANINDNTNSDVKITHTEDNTDIYTFWKDGFQIVSVYEIDANGKYVEDTTTISYKITPEIPRPYETTFFELKINNPNLRIIKAFIGSSFSESIDTINNNYREIKLTNYTYKSAKILSVGDNEFLINILVDYKGVTKYYKIKSRAYVLPEEEIQKYKNKELSNYYYPLTSMTLYKH